MPAENSNTGRSSSATTSRMMCTASASSSRSSSTCTVSKLVAAGRHVGSPSLSRVGPVAVHPFVGALIGLALQHRRRREPRILSERLEDGADDLGEVAPENRVGDLDRLDVLLVEPGAPALLLFAQHGDDMCDRVGVILGTGVAHRIGPAAPDPGLHGAPERNRLGHNVGPVDMDENRIAADDVADGREQPVSRAVGQACGALQQQRRLVPHQLAAPDAVGGAADGADVVTPDLGWRQVRLALVERIQQSKDRLVRQRPRTIASAAATGSSSAGTGRTHRARLPHPWRAAIRRAACCHCAATQAPDRPSGVACA